MKLFSKNQSRTRGAVRNFLVVPAVLALTVTLAACDDDNDAPVSGASEQSMPVDEFEGLTEVGAETFAGAGGFNFSTGGEVVGQCLLVDGGVTCLGQADDSAPDATKSLPGRPNGIELVDGSTEYINYAFDGPGPYERLSAGEKVALDGVTCGAVNDSELKCRDAGGHAWFVISGEDREIEVGGDGADEGPEPSAEEGAPAVTDIDPDKFAVNDTGKNAWVLEDRKTFCWVMEAGNYSPGVGCNVQLKNPPVDPTHGNPATKFHLGLDGEAWLSPDIAGFAPFDYQTLGANERVSIRGVTCTAHGGSDITCEAGGTTVEIKGGETPDLPVTDGMGGD